MIAAKQWIRFSVPTATFRWISPPRPSVRTLTVPAAASPEQPPKQFKDIPGPKGYPLIGTALDYRNDKYTIHRVIQGRLDKYGRIYREKVFPALPEQVMIFDPKDIESVFRAESEYPHRPEGGDLFLQIMKECGITTKGVLSA